MSELTVDAQDEGAVRLIAPRGHVNAHTVRLFDGAIQSALQEGRVNILIDCSGLAYIASAGLGALMGVIEDLRAQGGDLRLYGLSPSVLYIFETLGFHHLYQIYGDRAAALDSFSSPGPA